MSDSFMPEGAFDEFDNVTVSIIQEGGSSEKDAFGNAKPAAPLVVLPEQRAQEWELTSEEKQSLTGEQAMLRKKIRLRAYHGALGTNMIMLVDGKSHNIIACGHDGSFSNSIVTVERITAQKS